MRPRTDAAVPPCRQLGRQCRELDVTIRVANFADDSPTLQDAAATWLLGHTEHITFGTPYRDGDVLLVDATLHVGCRHLVDETGRTALRGGAGNGRSAPVRCAAHGFHGPMPPISKEPPPPVRQDDDSFHVVYRNRPQWLSLPLTARARRQQERALPIVEDNPCVGAPCRTADNARGAACCRDLTLDVVVPEGDEATEQFLRSRKAPYLCKVERADHEIVEAEVISACAYLDPEDGISCVLHDRLLPNRQLAKPSICREWPDIDEDEAGHPGCRLISS